MVYRIRPALSTGVAWRTTPTVPVTSDQISEIAKVTSGALPAIITGIGARALAVPCVTPYHWRSGRQDGINVTLITVETTLGVKGFGEATLDHPQSVIACVEAITPHLLGRAAGNVEAIVRAIMAHGRWRHTPRFTNAVVAGIESACWDAWGKALGLPASAFFGGPVRDVVDFFGFPQGDSAAELAAAARALTGDGSTVIYIKVGREDLEEDVQVVKEVRAAIGPNARLRVDANGAWDVPTAIDQIDKMAAFNIDWVEQPVDLQNISGLAQVRRSVKPKIAADQAVYSIGDLRAVLESEAADVIVLGHHESGGLWRLRQMAQIAEAHGVPLNRHGTLETSISTYAALQVLACIPNLTSGNQIMHQLLTTDLTEPPLALAAGKASIPEAPGLGFTLSTAAVDECARRFKLDGPYPPSS